MVALCASASPRADFIRKVNSCLALAEDGSTIGICSEMSGKEMYFKLGVLNIWLSTFGPVIKAKHKK